MALIVVIVILLFAPAVFSQVPATGTQPQPAQATQLPLSGRSTQGGSVTATQTAIPGTTNSINTINSTVQVQGPFSGSASSTARLPFSGKLSLREAVDRAVEFNLGPVGLNAAVQQARGQTRIARSVLLPLIASTVHNLEIKDPAQALTGTFSRGDVETVKRHLAALNNKDLVDALELYRLLGKRSLKLTKKHPQITQILKSV